ncbi:hypothetical protein AB8B12_22295 [Streptomyces sp. PGLac3x]
MDLSHLMSPEALGAFTQKRRASHGSDREVYDDLLAAIRAVYRAEHIPGDRRGAAGRRSRKMEKHAKRLIRGAQMQYEALERLQVAHANHLATVAALPEQRQAKALARAQRNAALGDFASKSLHKTAHALTSKDEETEAPGEGVPGSLYDLDKKRAAS